MKRCLGLLNLALVLLVFEDFLRASVRLLREWRAV